MLRLVTFSVLAGLSAAALSAPAEADHRWRHRYSFFPFVEVFPGDVDDEYIYYDEDEDEDGSVPPRLRRNLRAEDKWWLYDDEENLEPQEKKPARKPVKKKIASAPAKPVKVLPKPVEKPALLNSASAPAETLEIPGEKPVTAEAKPASKLASKPAPPLASAAITPAPKAKTIGCTAGAAVVTGYGFADVKPKTCTGDTYSYTASRGGKSFLIQITASSGEVVDVKKL